MKRRAFLSMLGLAPVAACAVPVVAKQTPNEYLKEVCGSIPVRYLPDGGLDIGEVRSSAIDLDQLSTEVAELQSSLTDLAIRAADLGA